MSNDRYARYGALGGVVAVIFILVGFLVATSGLPDVKDPATDWGSWFTENTGQIHFGSTLVAIGLFFYVWFLGSLRSALATAEGGRGRLTSIAFGSGIATVAFFVLSLSAFQAAALHPEQVDPVVLRSLNDIFVVSGAPAAGVFTALFAATAIVGYRYGALPPPVAGISALTAIAQVLALGTGVTDSGAFSADGVFGFLLPVITFFVAIATLSITLYRQPEPAAATAR